MRLAPGLRTRPTYVSTLLTLPVLGPRGGQTIGHRVISLVACVLEHLVGAPRHRDSNRPRLRPRLRVVHRVLVLKLVRANPRKPLDQTDAFWGSARTATRAHLRLASEVGGLHHERVALPTTARIAQPL